MRARDIGIALVLAAGLAGCSSADRDIHAREESRDKKDLRINDSETAAQKAGKAAYKLSQETEKAAQVVGHKLAEAGKEAHRGWEEAKHEPSSHSHK